ncbi:MAG TPA: outer membrane protein assembly factor BamD [Candidatus Acidoferrum sp.]|nr:outer membrane protein assembly factor BamD [Candidatus Acidoferrum sp.]
MARLFRPDGKLLGIIFCSLFAASFCGGAKAQTVQAQTGSSESQAQAANTQKQDRKKQEQEKKKKKKQEQEATNKKKEAAEKKQVAESHQKTIKVHVVHEDKKKPAAQPTGPSVAPDKVLYQRAEADIKKGRYTEGRLSLQTLINTYPDSEYLAKAKLATADSYYKEGGVSGLTQAVEEYKNFIIFFPFLDEAAYAQMQIGMAHFRMMEKPDRDTSQALDAEQEFQTFLLKYPKSPLVPQAEQHLRDVQEIIADGEFRVARFYYLKQDYPASAARLMELVERYPLYSQTDQALWMLANVYERAKRASKNEDDQNHWADLAAQCYDRILQNYPLSAFSGRAKSQLGGMGMKAPAADPEAMERMKHEQLYDSQHHQKPAFAFLKSPMALLKSSPSVLDAAHFGMPNLNPPNDVISAREVLKQGATGPNFELANQQLNAPLQAPPADNGTPVDADTSSSGDIPQGTGVGAQIISPTTGSDATPTQQSAPPTGAAGSEQPAESQPAADAPSGLSTLSGTTISTALPNTTPQPAPTAVAPVSGKSQPQPATQPASSASSSSVASPANAPAAQDPSAQDKKGKKYKTPKLDSSSESSSKKKKGIKKIIPW